MKAEIIAVGTELLLGQIVNSNAQFISQQCAGLGIDVYFQTVVGDNASRITGAVEVARKRAELIIFTGGLGPTQDDLTKDALAAYLGRTLHIHQPSMDKITSLFSSRGIHMVESNARQALILDGAAPLHNETGLAIGAALTQDGTHYVLLPGPPKEMKPMFVSEAIPWLRTVMGDETPLVSRMLKFAGIGESNLEHTLLDLIDGQQDPTIAPYAKEGEVTIRITTRAETDEAAEQRLSVCEEEIRRRVGQYIYADEDVSIETVIVRLLAEQKRTLAVAESCTGGQLSDMITAVPGSSAAFVGGVVCYSNSVKQKALGVPASMLEGEGAPGAISAEAAVVMAESLLSRFDTDFGVAITGVAGPSSSEGKPVGLVYIALAKKGEATAVDELQLSGGREMIKLKASKSALYRIWMQLVGR